jgi:acetyl esterase/lipase
MTGRRPWPVLRSPDLVYAVRDGRPLRVDVYRPRDVDARVPLIVWIHAGGWRTGDRRRAPDLTRHFAAAGFAMASIDYRSSRDATFPAQLDDVRAAIRWLSEHAEEYGIDARRLGLWGASSGGHLAALAALTANDGLEPAPERSAGDAGARVRAVVVGYAPIDFLTMDVQRDHGLHPTDDPSAFTLPPGACTADARSYESQLIGAPIHDRPDLARAASPLAYVHRGAPPFMIVHGLSDSAVPPEQSVQLYDALAEGGNDVSLHLIEGLGHGFLDRADFDERARRTETRSARHGVQTRTIDVPPLTFASIGAFFGRHLRDETGSTVPATDH